MKVFLFAVICKACKDGKEKVYLLFDELYPVLAKDEKDAIAKATLSCASDLEMEEEKAEAEGKEFSYEVQVRPF